jgi:hypothetical protein
MWISLLGCAFTAFLGLLVYGARLALKRTDVDRTLAICQRHGRTVSALSSGFRGSKIEFEPAGENSKASEDKSGPVNLDECSEENHETHSRNENDMT